MVVKGIYLVAGWAMESVREFVYPLTQQRAASHCFGV